MYLIEGGTSTEYVALIGSFLFVALEAIIRILTLALRTYETQTQLPPCSVADYRPCTQLLH